MEDELLQQELAQQQFFLTKRKRRSPEQVAIANNMEKLHSSGPASALLQQALTKRKQLVSLHRQRQDSLVFSLTAGFIGTTSIITLQTYGLFYVLFAISSRIGLHIVSTAFG